MDDLTRSLLQQHQAMISALVARLYKKGALDADDLKFINDFTADHADISDKKLGVLIDLDTPTT